MKRLSTILFLAFALFYTAYAQQALFSNWQLGKIGISIGGDQDMIHHLDHQYLLRTIDGPTNYDYSGMTFEEQDLASMVCDNSHLRLTIAFAPPGVKNTELRLSIVSITDRTDAVSFSGYDQQGQRRNLHFNLYSNELALEAVALKKLSLGRNVHFYGGMGTNTGYSYDNSMEISGDNLSVAQDGSLDFGAADDPVQQFRTMEYLSEQYQARDAFHQRMFLQVGMGVSLFKCLELNFDVRQGIGYRAHQGIEKKFTHLNSSSLGLYWYVFR